MNEFRVYRNWNAGGKVPALTAGCFLCACDSSAVAVTTAEVLAREVWRGYYVYVTDEEGTFIDFFHTGEQS